ncbi:MAG: carbohydrate-binding protein [Kibdelosporangium sp.]
MARTKLAALLAAVVTAGGLVTAVNVANAEPPAAAAACGELFDDFNYTAHTDPNLTAHGWSARSNAGGPGVPGATWAPENITFPTVDGDKVAQLASSTDGTAAGTRHTELLQSQMRFFEGTYAARVWFSDAPVSGPDGDRINQTFFTISPLRYDNDPLYSELDIAEYLPNGGWGEPTWPVNFETSWHTYQLEPWVSKNQYDKQLRSMAGWHNLVAQVSGGHIKYFIDGVQVADHSTINVGGQTLSVYPRQNMSLNFNHWFIDLTQHTGGAATYHERVDWVYYAKSQVVSPSAAVSQAATYRSTGVRFKDDLAGNCGTPPTDPPNPPDPPGPPADCTNAPAWAWGTVYLENERVKHNGSLWRARWWTQGSEPGLTAQWESLGRC